jgi:glycosyltransferase involved in cell wall biosynthesis
MNVLLLSINDREGGAARATYRLHQGLQKVGVSSQMLVQHKVSSDPTVANPFDKFSRAYNGLKVLLDRLPLIFYEQQGEVFSVQWLPDRLHNHITDLCPEVINLHWVGAGYVQIETLTHLHKPLVWTLHDMYPFTGGCHYSQDCDLYTAACGACPQLQSSRQQDVSRWIWHRKAKSWRSIDLTLVAPSQWLANCARSSSLFRNHRIEVIPNGIDTQIYKPVDRTVARHLLNLPQDRQLILFTATKATSDRRKGFHLLQTALQHLSQTPWRERVEAIVVGAGQPPESSPTLSTGIRTHYLGKLSDDISLALVYAAADVFVAPSTQDNLPNTVLEAIACGTPCVAFKIGGMPDLIDHQQNGYLAQPFQIEEFAEGIVWILADRERHRQLAIAARHKAEQEFSQELQARRYHDLFQQIVHQ